MTRSEVSPTPASLIERGRPRERQDRPLLTVVIATLNAAATLRQCLESVIGQTCGDWEIVVADGGSTDGSIEILRHYEHALAWWASEPDRGVYSAWNKALAHAHGDWVLFLGADDRLAAPDVLERTTPGLRSAGGCRVAYGRVDIVNGRKTVATAGWPWSEVRDAFLIGMHIPHQGVFHRRSLFRELGWFDEEFRIAGDYEFLLRELVDRDAVFLGITITVMATGGLSSNPHLQEIGAREARRAREMHGLFPRPSLPERARASVRMMLARLFGPRAAEAASVVYRAATGRPVYQRPRTVEQELALHREIGRQLRLARRHDARETPGT